MPYFNKTDKYLAHQLTQENIPSLVKEINDGKSIAKQLTVRTFHFWNPGNPEAFVAKEGDWLVVIGFRTFTVYTDEDFKKKFTPIEE